jgi:hypothetical protein
MSLIANPDYDMLQWENLTAFFLEKTKPPLVD